MRLTRYCIASLRADHQASRATPRGEKGSSSRAEGQGLQKAVPRRAKEDFSAAGPRYRNTNRFCNDKSLLQASAANLARWGQTSVLLGHSLPVCASDIATIILRSTNCVMGHNLAPCSCYLAPCGSRHHHRWF
jgi:hypothetical protein